VAGWAERPGGPAGRWADWAESEGKILFRIKIGFLKLLRLWKFVERDLGGILAWGFFLNSSRLLKDFRKKYNMPCHAMHPIQDFIFGKFFIWTTIWYAFLYALLVAQKSYSCKKWVLHVSGMERLVYYLGML
jgi:hypothetical protein